jgi:hypothetical protein
LQIVSTILFTLFFVKDMTVHYAITSFPAIIILISSSIEMIRSKYFSIFTKIFYPTFVVIFLILNIKSYGLLENHGWTMTEGWSLKKTKKAADIIFHDIGIEKYNVTMIVDAQTQGAPLRYFLRNWGRPPLPEYMYDKAQKLYAVVKQGINLREINLWEINSFGGYKIEKTWGLGNGFLLYKLDRI